jgi:uncharacterized phage protein (predicted DNA packaging)
MTVSLDTVKQHLNVTFDTDDELLTRLISVAQGWLESQLGYTLADRYPPTGSPAVSTVPAPLDHATSLMVGHFYANREATTVGVNVAALPLGVCDIVNDFRDWSWGDDG